MVTARLWRPAVQPQLGRIEHRQHRLWVGEDPDRADDRLGRDKLDLVVEHPVPSVVSTSTGNFSCGTRGLLVVAGLAGVLDDLVDRPLEEERALGQVVVLPWRISSNPRIDSSTGTYNAWRAGELLGDEETAATGNRSIFRARLTVSLSSSDSSSIPRIAMMSWSSPVALQDLLDLVGHAEVLLAEDLCLQNGAGRIERVDGRVDPLLRDRARQRSLSRSGCANNRRGRGSVRSSAGT